ncbi:FAD-dependent oxidoreductase [Coraliomargarita sinensis]|uniref:NADH:ubiquinone reductase (non-electrogenic) n=1 Tax=Coraliomargarita sinensis TaxID=2174842 RepID=A0A317ZJV1_9BACT|nr:NAD(P)/FAD-dependent oxidoreductase [Coraliomargarita sinensis]PXA05272.1 FAD-dependent oxidoreductase [Coraliomargarita sinensis]
MAKKKIVVLGAGFGGLAFTRALQHKDAEITLIDRQNHHLFQPLLYQVATAGLSMPEVSEPVRTIFQKRRDVNVLMAEVESIDVERKRVVLKGIDSVEYDYLVVGMGMVNAYFGHPEWAKHTIGLKSLDEARRIRRQILHAYERAEATKDMEERKRLMTHVVIGGGPTGVEMAGAISELTKRVFKHDFRSIRPEDSRIVLVEAAPRILGAYTEASSQKATEDLKRLGVEVITDAPVKDVRAGIVELDGQIIESESIIWTAGVEANPVLRSIPAEFDRRGRISVEQDTSLPGYPEVFVIGDVANMTDIKGQQVPGVSPAAMQMGKHAAKIIKKELKEFRRIPVKERKPFKYFDKGTMATIGRSKAVAEVGGLKFSGPFAWVLWLAVHLIFLVGFRNKAAVLLQWAYAYIGYRPGARVFDLRNPDPAPKPEEVVQEKV